MFVISFPNLTKGGRTALDAPESDGESQRISYGVVKPLPDFYSKTLDRLSPSSRAKDEYVATRVFVDADAVGGTSGAPILNERGQVLGVYGSHWNSKGAALEVEYFDGGGHGLCADIVRKFVP